MFGRANTGIRRLLAAASVLGASVSLSPVQAAFPPLGGSVPVTGTTAIARPELNSWLYQDVFTPFEIRDILGRTVVKGRLESVVVRARVGGRMHFYSRVFHEGGPGIVTRVTRSSFLWFAADMDYRLDLPGAIGPGRVGRTGAGDAVWFDFSNLPIGAGASSRYCFVITDAWWFNILGTTTIQARLGTGVYSVVLATAQPV